MKNKHIVRAYDSINPTASDKERMLKHILAQTHLEQPAGVQSRRVRPDVRPTRRAKSFGAGRLLPFAACFGALLLGGFLLIRLVASPEDPVLVDPSVDTPVYEMTAMDHYAPVLDKYRRAVQEGWTKEQCQIEGISLRMQHGTDFTKAGYALLDLDGDSREELIIAEESLPHMDQVWDLYTTLEDGTPIQLWVDECDGNQCNLYEGNIIGTEYSGKTWGESVYYTLESGRLAMRESIEYEGDNIVHADAEGNTRSITNQEFMEISNSYKHRKLSLTWVVEMPDYLRDTDSVERYTPVLEKYRTALTEHWTKEQCRIEGISPNMQYISAKTGYTFVDLDEDGREELIIAQEVSQEHDMVWDLYTTLEDGTPIQLWSDEEAFNHCRIFRNNIICISHEEDQPGEHTFYTLEAGHLVLLESIEYEADGIIHRNADGDTRSISAQEAMELVFDYKHQKLELTPFMEPEMSDPNVDYQPLLEKYQTALKEKWDFETCMENDISLMVSYYAEKPDELCAFWLDLDGDGKNELMITDGMMIFDLYTLRDGNPVHLLTGWERNSYRYCMDNVIFNHGSNSAFQSCYNYYRVENGALILVDSIVFDASADPENPWFLSSDGETAGDPITEEKANEIMEQYIDMTILGIPILQ